MTYVTHHVTAPRREGKTLLMDWDLAELFRGYPVRVGRQGHAIGLFPLTDAWEKSVEISRTIAAATNGFAIKSMKVLEIKMSALNSEAIKKRSALIGEVASRLGDAADGRGTIETKWVKENSDKIAALTDLITDPDQCTPRWNFWTEFGRACTAIGDAITKRRYDRDPSRWESPKTPFATSGAEVIVNHEDQTITLREKVESMTSVMDLKEKATKDALAKLGWVHRRTTSGSRAIEAERLRQIDKEGWTPEHDDAHDPGVLARAGAAYALEPCERSEKVVVRGGLTGMILVELWRKLWPFDNGWWKPRAHSGSYSLRERQQELAKAGALIAAEWERIERQIEKGQVSR